jgi:hypothetical protein
MCFITRAEEFTFLDLSRNAQIIREIGIPQAKKIMEQQK